MANRGAKVVIFFDIHKKSAIFIKNPAPYHHLFPLSLFPFASKKGTTCVLFMACSLSRPKRNNPFRCKGTAII